VDEERNARVESFKPIQRLFSRNVLNQAKGFISSIIKSEE